MVTFEDFKKLDIRIGKIISAEKIANTDKLLKLVVNFGNEKRDIVAGVGDCYKPEEIIGKEIPVILNLEPRKIRGIESKGMVLAVDVGNKPVLLYPEKEVPPGSIIR